MTPTRKLSLDVVIVNIKPVMPCFMGENEQYLVIAITLVRVTLEDATVWKIVVILKDKHTSHMGRINRR